MARQNKNPRNKKGELDMLKYSLVYSASSWKTYTFEIMGNVYFMRHKPKKPKDVIVLSEITKLEPSSEDSRIFTVCFGGLRRNWTLRASSKEVRKQWMEALIPGSSRLCQEDPPPSQVTSSAPPPPSSFDPPPYPGSSQTDPDPGFYPPLPQNYH